MQWISNVGLMMVIAGELIRKSAIVRHVQWMRLHISALLTTFV